MGRKSKEKVKTEENGVAGGGAGGIGGGGSSDVFKNLFGDIPEDGGGSLFSSSNPFRRKPDDHLKTPQQRQEEQSNQQLGLGFSRDVGGENGDNGGDPERNSAGFDEVKKKKRDKGRGPDVEADSVEEGVSQDLLEVKKRKKMKGRNSGNGNLEMIGKRSEAMERNGDMDAVVGMEIKNEEDGNSNEGNRDKKKKKRKRGEIEEEYEGRNLRIVAKVDGEEMGLGRKAVGEKRKTVDDPADMLVSKEGFDDESKLLRTVFVGNLPLKMKKKAMLKEFSRFGEVESVRIRSVPLLDSKIPRKGAIFKGKINESVDSVHAYIVFKEEQSAQASLTHNMAVVGGNHIRVDMACPPRKKLKGEKSQIYDNKRTVFVGNLPFDVKDEELYQLFSGIKQLESSIEAVRVVRDPNTSLGKGIAYVLFKTQDAVNFVIKKRNLRLRDRELRLSHARLDSTPSKKRKPLSALTDNPISKRFAMASSEIPSDKIKKSKAKATLTYQGLRAKKSVQMKVSSHPKTSKPRELMSRMDGGAKQKDRSSKRPAVAARKAAMNGGGTPSNTGKKRKPEHRTPQSSHQHKKSRKFR